MLYFLLWEKAFSYNGDCACPFRVIKHMHIAYLNKINIKLTAAVKIFLRNGDVNFLR